MEHNTQGTPDHNGQHVDTVAACVPVAVLNIDTVNVEIYNCSRRPVDTCTNRGLAEPHRAEWWNIPTTNARHQGNGETMARPFPFMADTPSERWRENNPSGTPRHLTRKQSNVRNF